MEGRRPDPVEHISLLKVRFKKEKKKKTLKKNIFLGIQQTLIYWKFPTPSSGFTENSLKRRKQPVCSSSVSLNVKLMTVIKEEWPDCCNNNSNNHLL